MSEPPPAGMSEFAMEALAFCDDLKLSFEQAVSLVQEYACESGKKVEIRVEWLSDAYFDATAAAVEFTPGRDGSSVQGGIYRISVTEGLLIKLIYSYEILLSVVSRTTERKSLGGLHLFPSDQGAEYVFRPSYFDLDLKEFLMDVDQEVFSMEELTVSIEQAFWPFEFEERRLSEYLKCYVLMAIRFLAVHEASHVSRGHLDYWQEIQGVSVISESHPIGGVEDKLTMMRLMEVDADQQAVFNLLFSFFDEDREDVELFSATFTTALSVLFSLFDMTARSEQSYNENSHPDPDVRVLAAVSCASVAIQHLFSSREALTNQLAKEMRGSLDESGVAIVRAFQELGVLGGGPQRLVGMEYNQLSGTVDDLLAKCYEAQPLWKHRVKGLLSEQELEPKD